MNQIKVTKLFKFDQIIICFSLAYLGLLFAGRAEHDIWLLVTAAVLFGKVVHITFHKLFYNKSRNKSQRIIDRLIPEGNIKAWKLWIIGIFLSGAFVSSCFLLNELSYFISIAAVFLMFVFPLIKRFTYLPYHYFGIFETACPVGGFIAANGRFEPFILFLAGAVFFWFFGLEISLAIYEHESDAETKIFSIPQAIGINKSQILSIFSYLFSITGFVIAGILNKRGIVFWIALLCFAIIFVRQTMLLKSKDAETAKIEFLQVNNFMAPILFIGTIIDIFYN